MKLRWAGKSSHVHVNDKEVKVVWLKLEVAMGNHATISTCTALILLQSKWLNLVWHCCLRNAAVWFVINRGMMLTFWCCFSDVFCDQQGCK